MHTVKLTEAELDKATDFAIKFWDTNNKYRSMNHGAGKMYNHRQQFAKCLMGFRSELAVAKFLGIPWNPKVNPSKNSTDLGDDIQVRAVGHPKGELILRHADQKYGRMSHRFVLIHSHKNPREYTVLGWTYGINALAKKEYWQNRDNGRPAAWFIPQGDLFDMDKWEND
jgi:hypothetical protein